jgi:hypothetical protein
VNLFGREMSGFAKALVILAAIFLIAAGMCGMQWAIGNGRLRGDYLLPLGLLELLAMLVSAAGILVVLIAWFLRSLIDNHSGNRGSDLQKLMDSDEQNKNDDGHG